MESNHPTGGLLRPAGFEDQSLALPGWRLCRLFPGLGRVARWSARWFGALARIARCYISPEVVTPPWLDTRPANQLYNTANVRVTLRRCNPINGARAAGSLARSDRSAARFTASSTQHTGPISRRVVSLALERCGVPPVRSVACDVGEHTNATRPPTCRRPPRQSRARDPAPGGPPGRSLRLSDQRRRRRRT
jgi:hypothetical protein